MNDNSESVESGSVSDSESSSAQTIETLEVNYSEQLDSILECQYWTFCLFAVFVGIFISYGMVSILKTFLR